MHLKKRERRKKTSLAVAALSGDGAALLCAFFYRNICRGTTAGTLLVFVFFCLVTAASVSDLKCRKISDRLCGLILGIAVAAVFFMPGVTPLERILSAAAIGSLMLTATLILPGVFGGGDIKLMAACGGFLGWEMIRDAFVTAVIAAALAVFLLRVSISCNSFFRSGNSFQIDFQQPIQLFCIVI